MVGEWAVGCWIRVVGRVGADYCDSKLCDLGSSNAGQEGVEEQMKA